MAKYVGLKLHTSTMAATHALFDLCAMPEYVGALRAEAQSAVAESGGVWQYSTIKNLRQLDSFLKESQRVNQSTFRKSPSSPNPSAPARDFI
jgi:hypothetical protein